MSGRYSSYQLVFEESLGLNFEFSDMLTRDTYLQTSKWFHLDSFDAKLYMEDTLPDFKTFGRLQAPELSVPPYEFYKIYDYIYPSDDQRAEFIRFLRRLLEETEVKVGMRGNTMMKMKGLPKYTVNWNKTLTFRGTNQEFLGERTFLTHENRQGLVASRSLVQVTANSSIPARDMTTNSLPEAASPCPTSLR